MVFVECDQSNGKNNTKRVHSCFTHHDFCCANKIIANNMNKWEESYTKLSDKWHSLACDLSVCMFKCQNVLFAWRFDRLNSKTHARTSRRFEAGAQQYVTFFHLYCIHLAIVFFTSIFHWNFFVEWKKKKVLQRIFNNFKILLFSREFCSFWISSEDFLNYD